ncbi:response regulator transcription factor [Clostridium sp. Marseille-P299]|uniref:response regulator transcription factor n=1 Tax=Clostridium sp. Marseille-P299 TaxID=1805477 RepID=UPI00082E225A|nr:response regulator transcription factor [Clostridium sp. Marseille-P299]
MNYILMIDDDIELLEVNAKFLRNEGYKVITATNAIDGINLLSNYNPSCILLDIMLPKLNGFDACKIIRQTTNAPIIFLSGKVGEEDKVKGLFLGADDYVTKPYSLRELSARIHVNIKRHQSSLPPSHLLAFPPLIINLIEHKAYYDNEEIILSNREFELLLLLTSKVNQTITFEEIGLKMWGTYTDNDRKNIMVTASRLRKKLESYVGLQNKIQTVWSKGYQFIYKVRK